MEGIKEAIAYITGLAVKAEDPKTVEINGKTYCTKDLVRYDAPEKAAPLARRVGAPTPQRNASEKRTRTPGTWQKKIKNFNRFF